MTDEEKKAIEDLRKTIKYYDEKLKTNPKIVSISIDNFDVDNLYVLFNLIQKQEIEIERLEDIKAFLTSIEEISFKVLSQKYVNTKDMKHSIYVINERVKYIQKMLDEVVNK